MLPKPIIKNSLNGLVREASEKLLTEGNVIESRNGLTYEICDQDTVLTSPRHRHLYLNGRSSNIYATIAETVWVLAGRNEIDPYLSFYMPRAENYSDDGKTWRGSYGTRIYKNHQIDNVIKMFEEDGIHTRRAVMSIFHPDMDTKSEIIKQIGYNKTKDTVCSQHLSFWVRENKLNCKLLIRSNDLIFGYSHINVFEFTLLQELVLNMINDLGYNVELGYFHHNATSFHIYDWSCSQAQAIVDSDNMKNVSPKGVKPILSNLNEESMQAFFNDIYNLISQAISAEDTSYLDPHNVDEVFVKYRVPKINNQLYDYVVALVMYTNFKLWKDYKLEFGYQDVTLSEFAEDFKECLKLSKFTNDRMKDALAGKK